jgi:hypothetical protein
MARRRGNRSAYFRTYFEEHPDLVDGSDNTALYAQWSRDHNGREMAQRDKQAMANVKSTLRSKHRGGGKRKGRRLLQRVTAAGARTGRSALEGLEVMIDNCLSLARQMDTAGLESVIKNLRDARNGVVLKSGL